MKLKADLSFLYESEREAEAVVKAVSPDNLVVPQGLKVESKRHGHYLLTSLYCEGKLETFVSTMEDLLACISVAEKTLKAANPQDRNQ